MSNPVDDKDVEAKPASGETEQPASNPVEGAAQPAPKPPAPAGDPPSAGSASVVFDDVLPDVGKGDSGHLIPPKTQPADIADSVTSAAVKRAIDEACAGLLEKQYEDGAYRACNEGGPATTGYALVALHYLRALERFPVAGAVTFIEQTQLENGSFPAFPRDTHGSLAAACACYAGLVVAGVPVLEDSMKRAWDYIFANGGFQAADPITQCFLAAAGLFDPTWLPEVPAAPLLIPGSRELIGDLMIAPLNLITCALPGLILGLRRRRKVPAPAQSLLGWMETQNIIDYLKKVQDPTGSWMGTVLHTSICAMTLHALGLPVSDAAIARAVRHFGVWRYTAVEAAQPWAQKALSFKQIFEQPREPSADVHQHNIDPEAWQFSPFNSDVWNTALVTYSLRSAGCASSKEADDRATVYMLSAQGRLKQPREWQKPKLRAPRKGAWAFEGDNSLCLDCDSTGQVLRALSLLTDRSSVGDAIEEGRAWLLGMQNEDGGWPAFTHGLPSKPAGPYPLGLFANGATIIDMPKSLKGWRLFLGDPSTEDLTGRVLTGLGAIGIRPQDQPAVDRAVAFLKSQISDNGAWWGRWECNYVPGTSYVITGLAAVGVDMSADWIQRALKWLEAHQRVDGGFGETIQSYVNLKFAGLARASNAYCTGLALSAMVAAGGDPQKIRRAVAYLLANQDKGDHLWPPGNYEIVLNNPLPFYTVPADVWTAPLQGLIDYQARFNRRAAEG